jgi:hypothetical protein
LNAQLAATGGALAAEACVGGGRRTELLRMNTRSRQARRLNSASSRLLQWACSCSGAAKTQ